MTQSDKVRICPTQQPTLLSLCLILVAGGLLMGCHVPTNPPAWSGNLKFSTVSSANVEVFRPRLFEDQGELYLEGSVRRAFGAASTIGSSLDLVFYSGNNVVLSEKPGSFSPSELPGRSYHWYDDGHYRIPLSQVPSGTSRIEIRAVTTHSDPLKTKVGQ
jgi:hypothetical protein